MTEYRLRVEGMMCQNSCGSTVHSALSNVKGVTQVQVSYPLKRAVVFANRETSIESLIEAVENVGFDASEMKPSIVLKVDGMMCQKSCGSTVQSALINVKGVTDAEVSFPRSEARIFGTASIESLIEAVENVGFDASEMNPTIVLRVEGMMCQKSCGSTVQSALMNVKGVTEAVVSYARKEAVVSGTASIESLIEAIENVGFDASPCSSSSSSGSKKVDSIVLKIFPDDEEEEKKKKEEETKKQKTRLRKEQIQPGDICVLLKVEGMSCASCQGKIERTMSKKIGIREAKVALLAGQAEIVFDPIKTSTQEIVDTINNLGFQSKCLKESSASNEDKSVSFYFTLGTTHFSIENVETMLRRSCDGILSVYDDDDDEQIICVDVEMTMLRETTRGPKSGPRDILDSLRQNYRHADVTEPPGGMSDIISTQESDIAQWRNRLFMALYVVLYPFILKKLRY